MYDTLQSVTSIDTNYIIYSYYQSYSIYITIDSNFVNVLTTDNKLVSAQLLDCGIVVKRLEILNSA